ncbi:MAG: hypothetical protein ACFE8A_08790 [Candidatus Hodarchaeota archaeon]
MSIMKNKSKKKLYLIIIVVTLSFNIFVLSLIKNQHSTFNSENLIDNKMDGIPQTSSSQSYQNVVWLKNADFSSGIEHWFNTTELDPTDVRASNSSGQADILVLGEERNFTYVVNFSRPEEWNTENNPYRPSYPVWPHDGSDQHEIREDGFWTRHSFQETPIQKPSVNWVHEVEMPVNMSDYIITSAEVSGTVNASVNRNIDANHKSDTPEGVQITPDYTWGVDYDHLQFYIRIAKPNYDPDTEPPREIAWNRTKILGLYNLSEGLDYRVMENTFMNTVPESDIKSYLTSALSKDYKNFSIIVGVDIFCEDNFHPTDWDQWESIYINSFSLNFTYRKKIDQFTSVSWNQRGNMINHTSEPYYSSTRIDNAQLNFKYKINQNWPSESYNSEIKFLINNISQVEYPYTKLRSYNYTELDGNFIEVKSGGYDVTDYIPIEKNITLTIQVLMLDEFNLDRLINISIDDIYFVISYTVFYNPPPPAADGDGKTKTTFIEEFWFFLLIAIIATAGAICLGSYLVYYIRVLKYPKPVRKVRKYRRTLKRKKLPSVDIISREKAFNSIYREFSAISFLKGKPIEKKPIADKIAKKTIE